VKMKSLVGVRRTCRASLCVTATILLAIHTPWPPSFAADQHTAGHTWGYGLQDGPGEWANLAPDFAACKLGQHQSPVDIGQSREANLSPIKFAYQSVPLDITDNGHTIMINYPPGSFIQVSGKQYELKQLHFHHPSENTIDGEARDMEAHLVHMDEAGSLAVVAVFLQKGDGNEFVQQVWKHLPNEKNHPEHVDKVTINATDLLPAHRAYFTYSGSLTTPPCSENVTWYVLKDAVDVSAGQVGRFADLYPNNSRPVQPLHGRVVEASR
jgi:carbonic anhydrase